MNLYSSYPTITFLQKEIETVY